MAGVNPRENAPTYPPAPRLDLVDDFHGPTVADPYRWLEDRDDARTQEWLAAQTALTSQERESWTRRDGF
ncbi:MAG: hypothetical protein KTQ12_11115, partial [Dermatophilaceae bacterium]|nr:hypothetical protein [Dermatophilaceae bacterium]